MLYVGNDVVDLAEERQSHKSSTTQFLKRVFTPAEQTLLSNSSHPELVLWIFWAAKETAFKIMSKLNGIQGFSHKEYEVCDLALGNIEAAGGEVRLKVAAEHGEVPVAVQWNGVCLHAVGGVLREDNEARAYECCWGQRDFGNPTQEILREFETGQSALSLEEKKSIQSPESAWVRFYVKKDIEKKTNSDYKDLQIIRPLKQGRMQPPTLLRQNQRAPMDLSISHHGAFVAWVFSF